MDISKTLEEKEVEQFVSIDRMSEGLGVVKSDDKIKYFYSSEYFGDHSENNIVGKNKEGKIVEVWNTVDLSWIKFKEG